MDRFVYFLRRANGEGPVKVGCSQSPSGRLQTFMSWSPYPLTIVAQLPGDTKLELRFHAHLTEAWSHGEWFHPTPLVLSVVERVATGTFDLAELPADGQRHSKPRAPVDMSWTDGRRYRSRLSRLFYRCGLQAPADVKAASEQFDTLNAEEQAAARVLIEAHLKDPVARGRLLDAPWAFREYAEWAKKHGAPPLTIGKAA